MDKIQGSNGQWYEGTVKNGRIWTKGGNTGVAPASDAPKKTLLSYASEADKAYAAARPDQYNVPGATPAAPIVPGGQPGRVPTRAAVTTPGGQPSRVPTRAPTTPTVIATGGYGSTRAAPAVAPVGPEVPGPSVPGWQPARVPSYGGLGTGQALPSPFGVSSLQTPTTSPTTPLVSAPRGQFPTAARPTTLAPAPVTPTGRGYDSTLSQADLASASRYTGQAVMYYNQSVESGAPNPGLLPNKMSVDVAAQIFPAFGYESAQDFLDAYGYQEVGPGQYIITDPISTGYGGTGYGYSRRISSGRGSGRAGGSDGNGLTNWVIGQ